MAHQVGRAVGSFLGGEPSRSQSRPQRVDSLFTDEQGRAFGNRADVLAGSRLNNPFSGTLQSALLNPQFGAQSQAQQDLVSQLQSGRQAQFNNLGIGDSPAAQTSIAASAAPALVQFQQNRVGNLLQASGQFGQQGLAEKGLNLQTLLALMNQGVPQFGQQSTGTGPTQGLFGILNQGAQALNQGGQALQSLTKGVGQAALLPA